MTKLGIIGAMQVEVEILLGQMDNKTARTVAGSEFCEGTLEGVDVVTGATWTSKGAFAAIKKFKLHPVVYIACAAVVGILLSF